MTENAVKESNVAQVNPAPAAEQATTVPATTVAAVPVDSTTVKQDKVTQAFIKNRLERKADKQRIAELEAKIATPPQAPATTAPVQQVAIAPAVPATNAEDMTAEIDAINELALDPDVMKVPGGIVDILESIDSNPRLSKLYKVDHTIAMREAKAIWAQKLGIAPAPVVPMTTATSGGMGGGDVNNDLDAIYKELQANRPGTPKYTQLVKKYNEVRARIA